MASTKNSPANVPAPPEKSAPQIALSREDLGNAIKADYDYLQSLRRLTAKARKRFGLKIAEYANRFHQGKIAPAARELGINEKTANEWANFGNRYRDVADDQLPETRDEARQARKARRYRKTGAHSKKKAGDRTSTTGTVPTVSTSTDAMAGLPQKRKDERGGNAAVTSSGKTGRPKQSPPSRPERTTNGEDRGEPKQADQPKRGPELRSIQEEGEEKPLPEDIRRAWETFRTQAISSIGAERFLIFMRKELSHLKMRRPEHRELDTVFEEVL